VRPELQDRAELVFDETKCELVADLYIASRRGHAEVLGEDFLPAPSFLGYWVYEAGVDTSSKSAAGPKVVRDVAASCHLRVIDLHADWNKLLRQNPEQFAALVPDGVHPNEVGCRKNHSTGLSARARSPEI
jgi:hypothetical protein